MTLRPTIEPRCDVDARSLFNRSSSIARIESISMSSSKSDSRRAISISLHLIIMRLKMIIMIHKSVKPPPPVRPATTTAHKRPTPLATPRRRDPCREGSHPAGHAKPCRADPNGLEVVEPCRSRPGGVGLGLEVVEPCQLVAKKLILVVEKLILWWFLVALG
uniref:Uncharacterized protein n=1 Tax=Fagus sylvatica TaxID=28930 RepID=A0A2N9FRL6_FAGSY